jgi:hypothetical protein
MNGRAMQQMNEATERNRRLLVLLLGPEKALEVMRKQREESDRREHERKVLRALTTRHEYAPTPSFSWVWIVIVCTLYAAMCGIYFCR